jgi:hypothetical protein
MLTIILLWWGLGLLVLSLGRHFYYRVRPAGTWHLMTIYGARGSGVFGLVVTLLSGGWFISIPVGLLVAGMAYFVSANSWIRKSYIDGVHQALIDDSNDESERDSE